LHNVGISNLADDLDLIFVEQAIVRHLFAALGSAFLFFHQLLRSFRTESPDRPEFFPAFLVVGDEKVFDFLD